MCLGLFVLSISTLGLIVEAYWKIKLMFTPLLDALLISVLVTPAIGIIGRKFKHERSLVGIYITLILAFGFLMTTTLYWEILERSGGVIASSGPERSSIMIDGLSIFMTVILFMVGISSSIFSIREIYGFGLTIFYTIYIAMMAVSYTHLTLPTKD